MKPVPKAVDLTKRTADEAVAWIRRQKQRFFADVWFNAPHLPVESIAPFFDSQRAPRDRAGRIYQWPGGDVVKYSPEYDSVVHASAQIKCRGSFLTPSTRREHPTHWLIYA